jgi:hypothetical protein
MALVEERSRCLAQGQPEQVMLALATRLIGELGKEEHGLHFVMVILVGGVEELRDLPNPAHQPDAAGQFFTDTVPLSPATTA